MREKFHWKEVVAEADRGLYKAKRNGRNQIAIATKERALQVAEQNE
jgi:PleD family two-component response regulator